MTATMTTQPVTTATMTMKAVRIHQYGGPEVLKYEDTPKPEAEAGQLLVRVQAAGVNPIDAKVRDHSFAMIPFTLPLILGWDVCGVVESLGAGAGGFQVGDEIYALQDMGRAGAYAEYVVLDANIAAPKPTSLDVIAAASVPMVAITAWQALYDQGDLTAGQRVLIHGASGGLGTFAVQFAKHTGAYVIGTASADSLDYVLELGADEVIDYQATPFEQAVSDVDLVLDFVGGDTQDRSYDVLKPGGTLVTTVQPPSQDKAFARSIQAKIFSAHRDALQLKEIGALIDGGKVRPVVDTVFPLSQAAQAHERIAKGGVRGKIVLQVGG
jgi:NADPH:quinone reductase-like Zn-dependent oxidoreductase